jgi:hypothetical protein
MKNLFFLVCAALALSSCSHTYYLSTSPNVPLFREKNEVQANGSLGYDGTGTGSKQAQVAYSVTNHFAIAGTYSDFRRGDQNRFNHSQAQYYEMTAGYFKPCHNQLVFEVFGGYGYCQQNHQYSVFETASLDFHKLVVRPIIGYTTNYFDVAFTPSINHLSYNNASVNITRNKTQLELIQKLDRAKNIFLFEPSITYRLGWKYVRLQAQWSITVPLNHHDLNLNRGQVSAGLSFAFAQRFMKKTNQRSSELQKK